MSDPPDASLAERYGDADNMIIVGIGASAGGLEALQKLLPGLPLNVGMAFVVVQHLAPKYHSTLPSLLAKHTEMPVKTIIDGMQVKPGTICITPPNKNVTLSSGRLVLKEGPGIGPKPSIDIFFESLAKEKMARAVGIVLSGTGKDGAHGIRAIKSNDGITMAQTIDSAKFEGMPRAAVETGLVDLVLPPEKIGEGLQTALRYPHLMGKAPVDGHLDEIGTILERVRQKTGIDFHGYKKSTIHRRISRRMAIHRFESPDAYVDHVNQHPQELDALAKDILISVTEFYRDSGAFEALTHSLRKVFEKKEPGDAFRAWVPGCSTGEEVYSLAILIAEMLGGEVEKYRFQIFATDIDEASVQTARKAIYPVATVTDMDRRLVETYFNYQDHSVKVKKTIRDMVVLARQDLINDTHFMHLDLISCRNLLIYINAGLQEKLLSLFHSSLNPTGLLFLGKSESIGQREDLFKTIDARWKIFQRKEAPGKTLPAPMRGRPLSKLSVPPYLPRKRPGDCALQEGRFLESLLGMMDCCAVVADENANIQYVRGDVRPYFRLPEGHVKDHLNAVEMARPTVRFILQSMIHKAGKTGKTVTSKTVNSDEGRQGVRIKVGPLQHDNPTGYQLIVFTPVQPSAYSPSTLSAEDADRERPRELERELADTRELLQDTIDELNTSTEELQSLNEELQAANEELQATNEELETSNEELQASNEELHTVNDELKAKSDEAAELLDNLAASEQRYRRLVDNMNEALMLCEIEYGPDKRPTDLVMRQANRAFEELVSIKSRDLPLRAGAAGLQEISSADMLERFEAIADGEDPQRFEIRLAALEKDLTLSVYNMGENRLGVVCRDDTERNRGQEALAASEKKYRELIETANSIIIRWDSKGIIRFINDYGLGFFGYSADELLDQDVMTIVPSVEKSSGRDLDALVKDIVIHPEKHTYVPSENLTKDGRTVWVAWSNKAILDQDGRVREILAIGNDINGLKETEERLNVSIGEKEVLLKEIHHRVKNNMQVISSLVSLQSDVIQDGTTRDILQNVSHRVRSMAIVHEKLYQAADLSNLEFADYAQSLLDYLWHSYDAKASGVELTTDFEPVYLTVNAAVPCGLILSELISNALKHAFKELGSGEVTVVLRKNGLHGTRLSIRDNGIGLPPDFDWRDTSSLGLRLVQMLAKQLHATVDVTTDKGTEFLIGFEEPSS